MRIAFPKSRENLFLAISALVIVPLLGYLAGTDIKVGIYIAGIIGALAYLFLCVIQPFTAFCGLILLGLTVWISNIQLVNDISLMIGVGGIFLTIWILRLLSRNAAFIILKEFWYLVGFTVTIVISTLINWGGPAGIGAVFTYIQLILLTVLMFNFVITSNRLHQLGYVFISSSVLMAGVVLLDQLSVLPQGLIRIFQSGVYTSNTFVTFERSGGIFGDPNFTALQLLAALPFILEFWSRESAGKKVVLILSAIVILWAFSYTYSMGGLVGLAVILLIKTFFLGNRNFVMMIIQASLLGFIGWWLVLNVLPEHFAARILFNLDMFQGFFNTYDLWSFRRLGTLRGDTWTAAYQTISQSPIWGHGLGNSVYLNPTHSVFLFYAPKLGAHNSFLTITGDLGIIGGLIFVILLLSALRGCWPKEYEDRDLRPIRAAVFVALVSTVVQGMAIDMQNQKLLWVLLGMALAIRRVSTHQDKQSSSEINTLPKPQSNLLTKDLSNENTGYSHRA